MRRRLGGVVTMAALAALVVAGCGSGGDDDDAGAAVSTTAPAAPEDAPAGETWCPVTTDQVSAVVHHDVVKGEPCTWSAPDLTSAVLEVYVSGTDAGHLAGSTATVDGVGDEAAFDAVDALVFERHGAYWAVQVLNIGGASDVRSKDAEVELAKLVVDNIG